MPVERMPSGGTVIEGKAVVGTRALVCYHGIKIYLETNGKMQLTRIATPANLRAIATEFTGKKYARSRKGLEKAFADLGHLLNKATTLDEVGMRHEQVASRPLRLEA